ncbi:MAG: heterodisulfide reductase-related iron-sulfur binding cluster [Micromonosporaceae bacterium]|jgi:glycolate oxidase iron-sulfur subunit
MGVPATGAPVPPRPDLRALAHACVHCGFCLPTCPTYELWGQEMDSPRGRIVLMNGILSGGAPSAATLTHLDRCLGCMACVTACPSGVRYDTLITEMRAELESVSRRPWRERWWRRLIFALFPYPGRLRLVRAPLRAAQRVGLDRLVARSRLLGRVAPGLATMAALAPRPVRRERLPARVPAVGRRRAVVGMLTGCVQREFFPQVNAATARVLAAEGCDVVIPPDQGCCGALSLHCGRREEAVRFARRTAEVFTRAGVDVVVVNAAGCGSAMKEYADLGVTGPPVQDLSEWLVELGPVAPRHPVPVTVAYHDACHLAHAQGIRDAPRRLLATVPELAVREIAGGEICCGSAGVYNLLQPRTGRDLGDRKAAAVAATGADLLVSANPGCSMQIAAALRRAGRELPVAHVAEVLDTAIRGAPPPWGSTGGTRTGPEAGTPAR